MEFRLVYEGSLKASGNAKGRVKEKQAIRKVLHRQLRTLWETHPSLEHARTWVKPNVSLINHFTFGDVGSTQLESLARKFDRCGFHFVPLVHKGFGLVCGLEILFLRRDNPGDLILSGGDIDNRVKTLLDALRIPENCSEVVGLPDDPDEDPFFCLLESDALVTDLRVTTDRLLTPRKEGEHENDVLLVIRVHAKATELTLQNLGLAS